MASLFCQIRQDIIDGNKDVADDMVLLRRIASPHEHLYLYPYVDKDGKRLGDSVKGDCPDLDKGLFALRSRAVSVLRDPCSVNVVTPENRARNYYFNGTVAGNNWAPCLHSGVGEAAETSCVNSVRATGKWRNWCTCKKGDMCNLNKDGTFSGMDIGCTSVAQATGFEFFKQWKKAKGQHLN